MECYYLRVNAPPDMRYNWDGHLDPCNSKRKQAGPGRTPPVEAGVRLTLALPDITSDRRSVDILSQHARAPEDESNPYGRRHLYRTRHRCQK